LLPHLSFRVQFFITVEGDSMQPTLRQDDCIVVAQVMPDEIVNGKIYVVHTTDGEIVVKRIIVDRDKKLYMLISDNSHKYLPFSKEENEIYSFSGS